MCGCPAVHRYVIGNRCGHFWHASRSSRKNQPNTRRPSQSLAALRCYSEAFFLRSLTVPPAEGYGRVERHPRFSLSPILPLSFIQETRRNRICGSTVSGLTAVANIMLRKGAHTKKKKRIQRRFNVKGTAKTQGSAKSIDLCNAADRPIVKGNHQHLVDFGGEHPFRMGTHNLNESCAVSCEARTSKKNKFREIRTCMGEQQQ